MLLHALAQLGPELYHFVVHESTYAEECLASAEKNIINIYK